MTISDDEKEAREWATSVLERSKVSRHALSPFALSAARTILALLDRPTMPGPDEVPDSLLDAMWAKLRDDCHSQRGMRNVYGVVRDWCTKPAEPRDEAWLVRGSDGSAWLYESLAAAEKRAAAERGSRIVHLREVEADRD